MLRRFLLFGGRRSRSGDRLKADGYIPTVSGGLKNSFYGSVRVHALLLFPEIFFFFLRGKQGETSGFVASETFFFVSFFSRVLMFEGKVFFFVFFVYIHICFLSIYIGCVFFGVFFIFFLFFFREFLFLPFLFLCMCVFYVCVIFY